LVRNCLCRGFEGIGDGDEAGIRIGRDGAGMDLADAAGAEKCEIDGHGRVFLIGPSVGPARDWYC
jgi:hypothetical protein